MTGAVSAILAALLLAAVSTLCDFVWAHFELQHRPTYGLTHGTPSVGTTDPGDPGRPVLLKATQAASLSQNRS